MQHANELTRPGAESVTSFHTLTKLAEDGGQLPVAVQWSMIERGGLSLQNHQEMQGIQHSLVLSIAADMTSHDVMIGDDFDMIDEPLHADVAEGEVSRHAVAIAVEGDGLIFVDAAGSDEASFEWAGRKWQGGGEVAGESRADGFGLVSTSAFAGTDTALSQMGI